MVDVVVNHDGLVGTNFSRITHFNKEKHYNDICHIIDWNISRFT